MISKTQNNLIKSHHELAKIVAGQKVLHLLSLGKDSLAVLEWLNFAKADITSIYFSMVAEHPADRRYFEYLKKTYPNVNFVWEYNTQELNRFREGIYQSPIKKLLEYNHWEFSDFSFSDMLEEMRIKYSCLYTAHGESKYESVTRASSFYNKGLLQGTKIYPLGLLTKKQVLSIIKKIKLHPSYKTAATTYDFPSYYKMKSAFDSSPKYKETMFHFYPLLKLDEYRYTKLLKVKK